MPRPLFSSSIPFPPLFVTFGASLFCAGLPKWAFRACYSAWFSVVLICPPPCKCRTNTKAVEVASPLHALDLTPMGVPCHCPIFIFLFVLPPSHRRQQFKYSLFVKLKSLLRTLGMGDRSLREPTLTQQEPRPTPHPQSGPTEGRRCIATNVSFLGVQVHQPAVAKEPKKRGVPGQKRLWNSNTCSGTPPKIPRKKGHLLKQDRVTPTPSRPNMPRRGIFSADELKCEEH
ncbi:hypothetical protein VUR80DRAFT_1979 [Thermomyces stellatus]